MRKELQLRQARKEDTALILSFIRELARDEKLEHGCLNARRQR